MYSWRVRCYLAALDVEPTREERLHALFRLAAFFDEPVKAVRVQQLTQPVMEWTAARSGDLDGVNPQVLLMRHF